MNECRRIGSPSAKSTVRTSSIERATYTFTPAALSSACIVRCAEEVELPALSSIPTHRQSWKMSMSGNPGFSPKAFSRPAVAFGSLPQPAGKVVQTAGGNSIQSSHSATDRCRSSSGWLLGAVSRKGRFTACHAGQVRCARLAAANSVRAGDPGRRIANRSARHRRSTAGACCRPSGPCALPCYGFPRRRRPRPLPCRCPRARRTRDDGRFLPRTLPAGSTRLRGPRFTPLAITTSFPSDRRKDAPATWAGANSSA